MRNFTLSHLGPQGPQGEEPVMSVSGPGERDSFLRERVSHTEPQMLTVAIDLDVMPWKVYCG
jgi:hypothetical protein